MTTQQSQSSYPTQKYPWAIDEIPVIMNLLTSNQDTLLTASLARELFDEIDWAWRMHDDADGLLSEASNHLQNSNIPITKAVVLGLGTIAGDVKTRHQFWTPMARIIQLSLFLRVIEHIVAERGLPADGVKIYAQDPSFTDEDTQLLQGLNVEVVSKPEAQEHVIDQTTFVYTPHLPQPITINTITRCVSHRPSMIIAQRFASLQDFLLPRREQWKETAETRVTSLEAFGSHHRDVEVSEQLTQLERNAHSYMVLHVFKSPETDPSSFGDQECFEGCKAADWYN